MVGTSGQNRTKRWGAGDGQRLQGRRTRCADAPGGSATKATCVVPLRIAWIAGPAPEKGTWVMLMPQTTLKRLAGKMRG